jgi:putative endonuclease
MPPGYAHQHGITRLVYYEVLSPPRRAIAREKQIKTWKRRKRIALIESVNPEWSDLAERLHPLPSLRSG